MEIESREMRKKIFLAAYAAGIGHLASAFSCVEIIRALYLEGVMRHDPKNPQWAERDLFVLSKGHGSLALYVALAKTGYFPEHELYRFCKPNTILGGEPNTLETPGVEASTGSLGHGLGIALGMALTLKLDDKTNHVYCLVGDGECQEGSIWEAVISAAAFKLDNLTLIVDNNHIQKMDFIDKIIGNESLGKQIESFGWQVRYTNGHDIAGLKETLLGSWEKDKPRCLVADTVKGKGVSMMENNPAWHFRMPNHKELNKFCDELCISLAELAAVREVQ